MGSLEQNTTLIYGIHIRESADDGSDFSNAAADYRVLFLGEDGFLHVKSSGGSVTDPYDVSGVANGNLWSMNKSSSQTLTSNTLTQITFDTALVDGGGSVIDLANDKFETPATGFYMVYGTWIWETTVPLTTGHISIKVGSVESAPLSRVHAATAGANGSIVTAAALSLTAGDDVTMWCHPGGAVTPTARGSASVHLATTFALQRVT